MNGGKGMDIITRESLMQDQAMQDLLQFLKLYKRNTEANDIFEMVSYIEGLEAKLDQAIGELSTIREQLSELQELSNRRPLKEALLDISTKMGESCENMKQQIFTIKEEVKSKTSEIVEEIKEKGEAALHKMSEFLGIKERLLGVKKSIEGNIEKADHAMALIKATGRHVRKAVNHMHNAGRIIAGKEETAQKEQGKVSAEGVIKAPWAVSKALYTTINKQVDACVGKLEQLDKRIVERGEEKAKDYVDSAVFHASADMNITADEFFNSEAFEVFMEINKGLACNERVLHPTVKTNPIAVR